MEFRGSFSRNGIDYILVNAYITAIQIDMLYNVDKNHKIFIEILEMSSK